MSDLKYLREFDFVLGLHSSGFLSVIKDRGDPVRNDDLAAKLRRYADQIDPATDDPVVKSGFEVNLEAERQRVQDERIAQIAKQAARQLVSENLPGLAKAAGDAAKKTAREEARKVVQEAFRNARIVGDQIWDGS